MRPPATEKGLAFGRLHQTCLGPLCFERVALYELPDNLKNVISTKTATGDRTNAKRCYTYPGIIVLIVLRFMPGPSLGAALTILQ
jgi:hypothetical protein